MCFVSVCMWHIFLLECVAVMSAKHSLYPLAQHIRRQWCIIRRADLEYSNHSTFSPLFALSCDHHAASAAVYTVCMCVCMCVSVTMTQFSHWYCQACPW